MAFQWLEMRIGEERDRRAKEAQILDRLPKAIKDLHDELSRCLEAYGKAFGVDTTEIHFNLAKIRIVVKEKRGSKWEAVCKVEVSADTLLPGFRVDKGGAEPLLIEVGVLPGGNLAYRTSDQYITLEEVTRRILDRALFPKLPE